MQGSAPPGVKSQSRGRKVGECMRAGSVAGHAMDGRCAPRYARFAPVLGAGIPNPNPNPNPNLTLTLTLTLTHRALGEELGLRIAHLLIGDHARAVLLHLRAKPHAPESDGARSGVSS